MSKADREQTAFSYRSGLWHFVVMSFGLCNAPATFQHLVEKVLKGLHQKTALEYLDDRTVFEQSFEKEMEKLTEVFESFRAAHLNFSPKNCHLFLKEVQFLAHIVSEHGVSTNPAKIDAVKVQPVPTDASSVKSLMGLCTYYRWYVKQFATIAAPLHNLIETGQKFLCNKECQTAFMQLKQALVSTPVLEFSDPSKPTLWIVMQMTLM